MCLYVIQCPPHGRPAVHHEATTPLPVSHQIHTPTQHPHKHDRDKVMALRFAAPASAYLATASLDRTVRVYN